MDRPRIVTWVVLALLLVGALSGCQKIDRNLQSTLVGLNGKLLLQPQGGNCVLDDLDLREEGYRLAGGVGGLGLIGDPRTVPVITAGDEANDLAGLIGTAPLDHDVAVLVVDDFTHGTGLVLGDRLFKLTEADLGGYATGHDAALDALLTDLETSGDVSHGALVYAFTLAVVAKLPNAAFLGFGGTQPPYLLQQAAFSVGGKTVVVQAVDTLGYRTDVIPAAIATGLDRAVAEYGVRRAAINMSFAIVPCSVVEDYNASGERSIDAYLDRLAASRLAGFRDGLASVVLTPFAGDPVQDYLNNPGQLPVEGLVALASSGNDALSFPYAPAAWPEVVAVGASLGTGAARAPFSNTADVRTGGAWFVAEDPIGVGGGGPRTAVGAVLAGTSFASPGAAVLTALDLGHATPRCWGAGEASPRLAMRGHPDLTLANGMAAACAP